MGLKDLFAAHADTTQNASEEHVIHVDGMHCNACERLVCTALEERGATHVTANHESGEVVYCGELDETTIADAVSSAGFSLA